MVSISNTNQYLYFGNQMFKKPKSNLSYEDYVKSEMESISSQLSVKTYKRGTDEFPVVRGKDVRVNIIWTNKNEKTTIYEFLIENNFWIQKNTNDADRRWMRQHADWWLDYLRDMVSEARAKQTTKKKPVNNTMVSETQEKFERMKNNDISR